MGCVFFASKPKKRRRVEMLTERGMKGGRWLFCGGLLSFGALLACAEESLGSPPIKIDTGDTAWMLASAGLVLLMTPGLAFFYGGLVRRKTSFLY